MSIKYFRLLISCLFVLLVCSAYGQFNFKVGYTGNYVKLDKVDDMFERYSALFDDENKVLKPATFHNGLELGVRYVFGDHIGIDVGLSSSRGSNDVNDVTIGASESFNTKWKSSINNLYIGLDNYFGWFGYGASIGYQQLKFKNKIDESDYVEILKQNALNSRFYIIIESVSDQTSFSLRPFISVNWEPYNLHDVELDLFPDSSASPSSFDEDMMVFGISLILYNGPGR